MAVSLSLSALDVVRTHEKLVNHEPEANDSHVFHVFSQLKWVYYSGKPTENAAYCFNKSISNSSNFI